jgi:hypothetical protein
MLGIGNLRLGTTRRRSGRGTTAARARRVVLALAIGVTACAALAPSPALAGRLLATGHDADSHCSHADDPQGQCHFVAVAVGYVRAGAPNPGKPLLLLDCTPEKSLALAINSALGPTASVTMCPRQDPAFRTESLTTSRYSAIVVGSSPDMINIDRQGTTPDSTSINARSKDIASFFNDGGGVLAFSGDVNGNGDPAFRQSYYEFVPIPLGGNQAVAPFRLTAEGQSLGFQDGPGGIGTSNDINCCPTHNSFQEPPAGSALSVAERDTGTPPAPETLFAEGTIGSSTIVPGPSTGAFIQTPSSKRCTRRKRIKIRIRQPAGTQVSRAVVFLNGKRVRTVRSRAFRRTGQVTVVIRKLPKRVARVKVVVRTANGVVHKRTRNYRLCAHNRRG